VKLSKAQSRLYESLTDKWIDLPSGVSRKTAFVLERKGLVEIYRQKIFVEGREGGFLSTNICKELKVNIRLRKKQNSC
jgi:hypothetical protein